MSQYNPPLNSAQRDMWPSLDFFQDVLNETFEHQPSLSSNGFGSAVSGTHVGAPVEMNPANEISTNIPKFSLVHHNQETNVQSQYVPAVNRYQLENDSCETMLANTSLFDSTICTSPNGLEYQILTPPWNPLQRVEQRTGKIP